ncbi:hypothetical protein BP5796_04339 [Coleophoma crateriformis]|uniref:Uncharacterized protein n=1 Tax=Coleophoma crateriformis TaxID=565419 RepID=A0A3D8SIK5_9HELO|nr:hypothetical protein BP5796_04339 [Coleophoma crateriformis]
MVDSQSSKAESASQPTTINAEETPPQEPKSTENGYIPSVPPVVDEALEVDAIEINETDSAYSGSYASFNTSLASSIRNYMYENGRRYHAYREGEYVLPNDEAEQDRLDFAHHLFKMVLGGSLFAAPISPGLHRVLDVGTGTGIWAIDFADEFPSAEVIGNDLSPIQPSWVPANCHFVVDDVNSDWNYSPQEAFDFVHVRMMGGAITDWGKFLSEIYTHLNPGGWVEIDGLETFPKSDDGTGENAHAFNDWSTKVNEAAASFGKVFDIQAQAQNMTNAGFVDVVDKTYKVPVGPWAKDKKAKELGRYHMVHMLDVVEPYTLGLFTRVLGWSKDECEVLMAKVRADIRNPSIHTYVDWHFIYGRKPL